MLHVVLELSELIVPVPSRLRQVMTHDWVDCFSALQTRHHAAGLSGMIYSLSHEVRPWPDGRWAWLNMQISCQSQKWKPFIGQCGRNNHLLVLLSCLLDDVRTTTSVKFDAPATSYVIRQLTPGSTYRLRIKSSSFAAESAFTDFIQGFVLPTGNTLTWDSEKMTVSALALLIGRSIK